MDRIYFLFQNLYSVFQQKYNAVFTDINSQHIMFVVTSLSFAFFACWWKKKSLRKVLRNIGRYARSKRFQQEFLKDVRYLPVRIVLQAIIVITIGYNLGYLDRFIKKTMIFGFGLDWEQPLLFLDSFYGTIFQIIMVMLITDFAEFWTHYAGHRVENFWFFHKMHHRVTSMNSLTKVRFHPVDDYMITLVRFSIAAPLLFLFQKTYAIEPSDYKLLNKIIVMGLLYFGLNHLRHTSIRIHYPKFLSYILVSPVMHQVHHSSKPEHFDKNFGTVFSFWDIFMGTLYIPKKDEYFKFGINEERNQVLSLRQELTFPFVELYKKYFKGKAKSSSPAVAPVATVKISKTSIKTNV